MQPFQPTENRWHAAKRLSKKPGKKACSTYKQPAFVEYNKAYLRLSTRAVVPQPLQLPRLTDTKVGGIADVIGSLPQELAALGHDVRIFIPRYGIIDPDHWGLQPTEVELMVPLAGWYHRVSIMQTMLPNTAVTVYFLDHDGYFGWPKRIYFGLDQIDEQRRFLLFCRGSLEALSQLGFAPDIIYLNDWQTAPCSAYSGTSGRKLVERRYACPFYPFTQVPWPASPRANIPVLAYPKSITNGG